LLGRRALSLSTHLLADAVPKRRESPGTPGDRQQQDHHGEAYDIWVGHTGDHRGEARQSDQAAADCDGLSVERGKGKHGEYCKEERDVGIGRCVGIDPGEHRQDEQRRQRRAERIPLVHQQGRRRSVEEQQGPP